MFSIQKMIRFALLVTICVRTATAEQTLKVFTHSDFHLLINIDGSVANRVMPLYGGSDQSGFTVKFDIDSPALIPIANFELPDAKVDQDAIVGMVQCRHMRGAALVLSASESIRSSLALTDDGDGLAFEFFNLPIPKGFSAGQLTLLFQSPNVLRPGDGVAFANLRLIRGEPSKSTTVVPPPMPADTDSFHATDSLTTQVLREFTGNDFDSHVLSSSDFTPTPLRLMGDLSANAASAEVFVAPVAALRSIPIFAIDDPPITQSNYAVSGEVSYSGVGGAVEVDGYGYLEMWSDFADGSSYFTRTLAGSGLLRQIRGRSGPRPFLLPFNAAGKRPTRIRMNLVMSDRGTVSMTNLTLVQYVQPIAPATSRSDHNAIFNPRLLYIPVIVLPMYAFIVLMEPLVRRGKGRSFVLIWTWIFFALAQFSIAWGMAAWGHGLSIRQVGPMLLASILILGCTLFTVPRMSSRYRDAELRRMQLMDIA